MKYSSNNQPLKCIMTNSTCYKNTREMTVLGVLWHSTGANNPSLKRYVQPSSNDSNYSKLMDTLGKNSNGNDWNHISLEAGVNAWIGKTNDGTVTTVQTLPWNYRPWGCGSGSKGSCNSGWIQFEICEDGLSDSTYFNKVYKEACELTAYLCKKYNINPKGRVTYAGVSVPTILCHYDSYNLGLGSNHGDVYHWFNKHGKTMDSVRNDVAKLMEESSATASVQVTGTPSTGTAADEKKIWDYLYKKLNNEYGVAGIMGNMYAESRLTSNNLQGAFEKSLNLSDSEYTKKVDNGTYTNFVHDGAGYGLVQWTYWSLKEDLLKFAQSKKKSVGDLEMQLEFLCKQLSESYKTSVWDVLKSAKSVLEASNAMLLKFERPSDTGETVQQKRAEYGKTYYDKYRTKEVTQMAVTICHASISENGNAGWDGKAKAGDQTGKEVCTRSWYSKPWDVMLRYKDAAIAKKAAAIAKKLAASNLVGYDQSQRNTLYNKLKANDWDVDKYIASGVKTETDCSAFMYACYCCLVPGMRSNDNAPTTSTMKSFYTSHGFTAYTASKYVGQSSYLEIGDVLVKAGAHTVMAVTQGANVTTPSSGNTSSTNKNYVGKGIGTATALATMNVRKGAGTSYAIYDTIAKGTQVEVLEKLSSGWFKIVWTKCSNGYAYVSGKSEYFSYKAKATKTKVASVKPASSLSSLSGSYKTTAGLNIRDGAGTKYDILTTIPSGTTVRNNGYYTTVSDVKWLYVTFTYQGVEYTGFASSKYLQKI